ncbi:HTH-type transcriptional activator mta [Aquicella siphonis]|uniref:HTH-type transcriptional activator mta n=1 Tax=Aquicella siphonis TaxID=254247 RepID=A0A5E4PFW6_9COXI|nr:MerR family transcriptional regulator [Aquicella siphonis]VVC75734.1 HTH-type transcriptional activator mta [Aquicella siphonis]
MAYTVKKLAKLSGVSIRTLHFYDEIGLLKPAYYGDNRYRYYQEEQLLMLQQILFYRELGFALDDIQRIIDSDDFNQIDALNSHRQVLERNLDRTKQLIKTIDKTIDHLRGKTTMKNEELYYGFDSERQKQYEKDLVKEGVVTQRFMDEYRKKIDKWSQEEKDRFIEEGRLINQDLIHAIENHLRPDSSEVQTIIKKHHGWVGWTPTREGYIGLSEKYLTPEFRQFYEKLHPGLTEFIVEAMKIFANRELS